MGSLEAWPGEFQDLSTGRRVWVSRSVPTGAAAVVADPARVHDAGIDGRPGERRPVHAAAATPIVYVHGLGGAASNWAPLMRELRDDAPQWAFDLPGFGDSPPSGRHTVGAYVHDVVSFLSRFDTPAHLVANSLGGMIAVYVAARRPDLVRTLALVSPAMPQYRLPWAAQATAVLAVPGLGERIVRRAHAVPTERQIAQLAAILLADPSALPADELDFAVRERSRWMGQPHSAQVLLGALRSIVAQYTLPPRRSAWGAATRVLCPTLVLLGGRDTLVGSWGRARWQRARPNSRLVMMPSSGHVAMIEHPRAVAELIRQFHRDASVSRVSV